MFYASVNALRISRKFGFINFILTRTCGARFGRHGTTPPASNNTGTALGQDGSDWWRDLATLTLDLEVMALVGDAGRRPPSVYQVWSSSALRFARCVSALMGLVTWTFDLETRKPVTSKEGNLQCEFGHARPLGSRVIRYVRDGRTDGRTKATLNAPFLRAGA